MGQAVASAVHSTPESRESAVTPVERELNLHQIEDWVILEKCACGEGCYAIPEVPVKINEHHGEVHTVPEKLANQNLDVEIPHSLVKLEYNLTAEVSGSDEHECPPKNNEQQEKGFTAYRKGAGEMLFKGARWGYFGARSILPVLPLGLEDMVETLEEGMGLF